MRYQWSIFWIRGDQFTSFVTEVTQTSALFDLSTEDNDHLITDRSILLQRTLQKLNELSGEWLLILNNADDLDQFLGRTGVTKPDSISISQFIPRRGRVLITTRDSRFQGVVAAASDGQRVLPMNTFEAEDLLFISITPHLASGRDVTQRTKELLEQLGYLPLAIAQASANILEEQLSLADYAQRYQDKKQRTELMKTPMHDSQNTDPRNSSQSVLVT